MAITGSQLRASRDRLAAVAALPLCVVIIGIAAPNSLAAGPHAQPSARRQSVEDRTHLHLVGPPGVEITEKGTAKGTHPGPVVSHLKFSGGHLSGSFVLHTNGGIVRGHENGSVVGKSAKPVVTFSGAISITGGTGKYANASGRLHLKGSIRRSNYAIAERTTGQVRL
jgi:hypothetical protein